MAFDPLLPRREQTIAEIIDSTRGNLVALADADAAHAANADAHALAPIRAAAAAYTAHAASQDEHGLPAVRTSVSANAAEIAAARGTQTTLAARLAAGLNADGSVRLSGVASKWIAPGDTPTYVSTTSFSVSTDRRGVYIAGAILRFTVSGQQVYGAVASSAFAGGVTTVTLDPAYPVLTSGLSAVELALIAFDNTLAASLATEQAQRLLLASQITALAVETIAASKNGSPSASEVVLRFVAHRAFTLPAGATGSRAAAGTAATGSTATFTLAKNGTAIGTMAFAVGASSASFTVSAAVSFAAGDVLTVAAPSVPNAALANLAISIRGVLQ